MKLVKVYALFVWNEDEFSTINVYKSEEKAYEEFNKIRNKYADNFISERDCIGGKEFLCGSTIVRVHEFEVSSLRFDSNIDLKNGCSFYVYASMVSDTYDGIAYVGTASKRQAKVSIISWYENVLDYYRNAKESRNNILRLKKSMKRSFFNIDNFKDYITSDCGKCGGYHTGFAVKKITTIQ